MRKPMDFKRFYLTGFMGSAKSTVGRILAYLLRYPFTCLDELIIKESGMSIPDIFELKGEGTFTKMETDAVRFI